MILALLAELCNFCFQPNVKRNTHKFVNGHRGKALTYPPKQPTGSSRKWKTLCIFLECALISLALNADRLIRQTPPKNKLSLATQRMG